MGEMAGDAYGEIRVELRDLRSRMDRLAAEIVDALLPRIQAETSLTVELRVGPLEEKLSAQEGEIREIRASLRAVYRLIGWAAGIVGTVVGGAVLALLVR